MPIIGNLIHSIKLIAAKVLPKLPISGNVKFDDLWEEDTPVVNIFKDNKMADNSDIKIEM